jgi:hypothetical protein
VRKYIPRAAEGPREVAVDASSQTPAITEDAAPATTTDAAPATETATAAADLTAGSPAVGSNLGGDGGSTGLGSFLPFVGGAALMLFLVLVIVKRRGAT